MIQGEKDAAKRTKLENLRMSPDEWDRVKLFLDLLSVRFVNFFSEI